MPGFVKLFRNLGEKSGDAWVMKNDADFQRMANDTKNVPKYTLYIDTKFKYLLRLNIVFKIITLVTFVFLQNEGLISLSNDTNT